MGRADMARRVHFPGVGDHGMSDTGMVRQPGRPCTCFHGREYAGRPKREEGKSGAGSRMAL